MKCRSVLKRRRRVIDRDGFSFVFGFAGELLFSPAHEAMAGRIVFPQGTMRPLEPLHVPERDHDAQKQLLPGGGGCRPNLSCFSISMCLGRKNGASPSR